jgi:hypothetical protein
VVATGTLLAFAPWFSASAVAPLIAVEWRTTGLDLPLLTVAVQLGFAAAAFGLAASAVVDVVAAPRLFFGGTRSRPSPTWGLPLVGIIAMWRLRGRPDASSMAGGRR